jgi:hypothetical protein
MPETKEVGSPSPGRVIAVLGILILLVSGAILASHVYAWLTLSSWPEYLMFELFSDLGLPHPKVAWGSAQQIIHWVMSAPAAFVLFWLGLGVAMLGFNMLGKHNRRRQVLGFRARPPKRY